MADIIYGVNGSLAYTEKGAGQLVAFFTSLVRGLDETYIKKAVDSIIKDASNSYAALEDLLVMAFQARDIRGGKGEKQIFYYLLAHLLEKMKVADKSAVIGKVLGLISEYGYFNDYWRLIDASPESREAVFEVILEQIKKDEGDMAAGKSISLLAKWFPREGSKFGKHFNAFCRKLKCSKKDLRKRISVLNKYLKTVEINMCGGTWADIKPDAVPGRNMFLHKKAFLNENTEKRIKKLIAAAKASTTNDEDRHLNYYTERLRRARLMVEMHDKLKIRFPDREDRMKCRQQFIEFFEKVVKGEAKIKGGDVLMPHEIVKGIINNMNGRDFEKDPEMQSLEGQWKAVSEKMGSFDKLICLADFSGSMEGLPMLVSMALGIIISEKTAPAFRNRLITFHDNPSWIEMQETDRIWDKIRTCQKAPWGGSTNFESAYKLVLNRLVEQRVEPGAEPDDLVVLTDMGWDGASGRYPFHIDNIKDQFKKAGEGLWGEGKGWKVPRIVIWNLRSEFKQYQATETTQGVVMISGWHPSILKRLQEGVKITTPWDGMRWILDAERYLPVRKAFRGED
jgi:hypothetical protein